MRRGAPLGHDRRKERAASATCECGRSRRRPDGSIAPACPRCTALDGEGGPAAEMIAELRVLGRSGWAALRDAIPGYSSRSLLRAAAKLRRAGRVRRREVIEMDLSEGMMFTSKTQPGKRVVYVATFELVEEGWAS